MKKCKFLLILIILYSVCFAQTEKIPNTNAGKKLSLLLEALNSGNSEVLLSNHISESSFNEAPRKEQERFIGMVNRMHGGFSFNSAIKSSENEIHALVKSNNKMDAYRLIVLETTESSPHKIKSWDLQRVDRPTKDNNEVTMMSEDEVLKWVDGELNRLTEEDKFSGAFLIAKNGEPIFKKGYGFASREFSVENNPNTKFNIGSINKAFTQVAIAQLLESNKIDVDDKIGKYIDGFPNEISEKVTIRQLLTMTSGMSHYWNDDYTCKYPGIRTVDDLMDIIKKIPLDFEPGIDRQYSNSGYVVLGAVIEKVTDMNYYEYVRENIYKPAGMKNTDSFDMEQIIENAATGYFPNEADEPQMDKEFQNNIYHRAVKGAPAGGGYSTVEDLNRFVEALKENKLVSLNYTNMILEFYENYDDPTARPDGYDIDGGSPYGVRAVIEADFISGYTVVALSNLTPTSVPNIALKTLQSLAK